jgi:hypothetical protein
MSRDHSAARIIGTARTRAISGSSAESALPFGVLLRD